jgi:hypothetical protein
MTNSAQVLMSVGNRTLRKMFFALAVVCTLTSVGLHRAQAQTFSVIHNFTGRADGEFPIAGLIIACARPSWRCAKAPVTKFCSIPG